MSTVTPHSCIVHGPAGCWKTTHAIAKALGLRHILNNWAAGALVPLLDTLVLTDPGDPACYFSGRGLTYDQAMQLIEHEEAKELAAREAEQQVVAWLGQAGLYRTRFDAVRNYEQSVVPVTADALFDLARKEALRELGAGRQTACHSIPGATAKEQEDYQ